jgi:plasmid stabilization system protein ParE
VAVLTYGDGAFEDLDRIADFFAEDSALAESTVALIWAGIQMLADHPLIGRVVEYDFRELILSKGRTGYLVLYDYDEKDDSVVVCAIRHQRETGYRFEENA